MDEQKELKIDVDRVVAEALNTMAPGDDFDQALLRVLKSRYPDNYSTIFTLLSSFIDVRVSQDGSSREEAARHVARSQAQVTIQVSAGQGGISGKTTLSPEELEKKLDQFPPEVRQKIEEAMRTGKFSGEPTVIVTRAEGVTVEGKGVEELPAAVRERIMERPGSDKASTSPTPVVARESRGCLGVVVLGMAIAVVVAAMVIR